MLSVKSLICKEKMLDPILCCAILQILRARWGDPGFCCEIGREGWAAFCDENAARRGCGKTVQLAATTQHKLARSGRRRGRRAEEDEDEHEQHQRGAGGYKT